MLSVSILAPHNLLYISTAYFQKAPFPIIIYARYLIINDTQKKLCK